MSYIKCKSFITNKDVQYGLIDVKLKHNILQQNYGTVNTSSTTYWNTSPGLLATSKMKLDESNNLYSNVNAMKMGMISGRKEQAYSASGVLDSEYIYVRSGKQPIISNRVFDVEEMNEGYNQFDLFETDNIKVILECLKIKASKLYISSLDNFSFREVDGSLTEDPYVIADCVIKQILKSSNTVIGEYSYIYNIRDDVFPIKFALNTEVFRIVDFDPSYYTAAYYSNRYSLWLDDSCTQNNKLYNNGEFVSGKGDFIGITVSVFMSDYWYSPRNGYDMNRRQITNTDGTIISNTLLRNFNNTAQNSLYSHYINNNPNKFIIFGEPLVGHSYFTTTQETIDIANSAINSENNYLTKGYNYSDANVVFPWNFILSPIMAPLVTTDYKEISSGTSGVFIPLTNTVYEGDPDNPDVPVNPDDPETTEPADDPNTDYTPPNGDGEVNFVYPALDPISSNPGAVNAYRPSLTNYIFKQVRYSSNSEIGNNLVLQTMVDGVNNITMWSLFRDLYAFVGNSVKDEDVISRIYYLPFEFDEIFTKNASAGHFESTPYIGGLGPILYTPVRDGSNISVSAHPNYFNQLSNRFYIFDLGHTTIQKVFNNYLDYKASYNLILPYGAGEVEIEPDFLFLNSNEGSVKITGYLDIDTGMLIVKVDVNNQLYYETSVNVACDISIYGNDQMKVVHAINKMLLAGAGIMYKGKLSDVKEEEAKGRSKALIDYRTQSKEQFATFSHSLKMRENEEKFDNALLKMYEEWDRREAFQLNKDTRAMQRMEKEQANKLTNREHDRETRENLLKIQLAAQAKHDAEMAHYGYTPRGYMKDPTNPNSLYR